MLLLLLLGCCRRATCCGVRRLRVRNTLWRRRSPAAQERLARRRRVDANPPPAMRGYRGHLLVQRVMSWERVGAYTRARSEATLATRGEHPRSRATRIRPPPEFRSCGRRLGAHTVRGIILLVRTTLRPGPGESGLGMAYHACAQLRRPFRLRLRPSRDVARGEIGGGLTAGIIAALLQLLVAPRRPGHLRRPARRRRRARLNGEVDDSAAIGDM